MAAATASPLRRRARDHPDDDVEDALELEAEGQLRGHESFDSDSTQDDDYAPEARRLRLQHHRSPPRRRPRLQELDALDILLLGPSLLLSPTPSVECESDATLSDNDHHHGRVGGGGGGNATGSSSSAAGNSSSAAAAAAAADAVGRGWDATGKRGWKAGGRHRRRRVVLSDSDSDLNTISSKGEGQAGTTASSSSLQAAPTAVHHQQPPPPPLQQQAAQRATEYTCKVCGKSYATNQALGGHAAGHKNKQRRAASIAAAFPFPLGRGGAGGKADEPHECRKCGKVFASGVALGGHMRVHYTGPPIVPARKNKKRCLAPPPPAEGDIAVAAPPVGLSLALSIKTDEESPSTPPDAPAGAAVRAVRLFGIDVSPQVQQAPLPLQQQQQGSRGTSTEGSSSTVQQQH